MKLVLTIDYFADIHGGDIVHYAIDGESPEAIKKEFFSSLETEVKALVDIQAKTKAELAELEIQYNTLANKKYKNRRNEPQEFRKEHYLEPKHKILQGKVHNYGFKFRSNKFDITSFINSEYTIKYDMVVVRTLDEWYTDHLMESQ